MKYLIYTLIVFFLALVETSFISPLKFIPVYVNLLYIILFSYYLIRQNNLSLYLCFTGGLFLDLFSVSKLGFTSANIFISIFIYNLISRFIPAEKIAGKAVCLAISSTAFYFSSYITLNFIRHNDLNGIYLLVPWSIVTAIMIVIITNIASILKPSKNDRKISLG